MAHFFVTETGRCGTLCMIVLKQMGVPASHEAFFTLDRRAFTEQDRAANAAHLTNDVTLMERPSGGKDSITLTWLARKGFAPERMPFPLFHIDTGHNFAETLTCRDQFDRDLGCELVVRSVEDSISHGRVTDETGPGAILIRHCQPALRAGDLYQGAQLLRRREAIEGRLAKEGVLALAQSAAAATDDAAA